VSAVKYSIGPTMRDGQSARTCMKCGSETLTGYLDCRPINIGTGHVSVYWDSPFWDLNFEMRAGQYLAGDRGLTLKITRRFSTGVENRRLGH